MAPLTRLRFLCQKLLIERTKKEIVNSSISVLVVLTPFWGPADTSPNSSGSPSSLTLDYITIIDWAYIGNWPLIKKTQYNSNTIQDKFKFVQYNTIQFLDLPKFNNSIQYGPLCIVFNTIHLELVNPEFMAVRLRKQN